MKIYLPPSAFFEEGEYSEWEIKNLRKKWKSNSQAIRIINDAIKPLKSVVGQVQDDLDRIRKANLPKSETLTEDQVRTWRIALLGIFGPYAMLMPIGQIQAFRDKMQAEADRTK